MAGWESNKFKVHAVCAIPHTATGMDLATSFIARLARFIQAGNFNIEALLRALLGSQPGGTQYTVFDFDVLNYTDAWELNAIPSANLSLAVGRRADRPTDPASVSQVHRAVEELRIQVPVVVYAKAVRLASGGRWFSSWPTNPDGSAKEVVLFRGLAVGGAFSRAFGDARYTLALAHWLVDMNFSSCMSRTTHPMTPNSYFTPASFAFNQSRFGGGAISAFVGAGLASTFFSSNAVTRDFWGGTNPSNAKGGSVDGLKSWFKALSSQDRINFVEINKGIGQAGADACLMSQPAQNVEALRALAKFEPFANGLTEKEVGPTGYRLGVPLAMDLKGTSTLIAARKIWEEVGFETFESYSNMTLWDKLAGQFHANYLFSVVPTVETALVVPFIPGLRGPQHRNVFSYEYGGITPSINLQRALRGVGVLMGRTWVAGTALGNNQQPDFASIGGWYGVCRDGMIQFKGAPRWLTMSAPPVYALGSSPAGGAPVKTAVGGAGRAPSGPDPRGVFADAKELWNAYAQALYVHEILKHRQAQLTGRVRFDIAPGSLLHIECAEDKFVDWLLGHRDPSWIWAAVLRTSTTIDSESDRAATSFHLAHIRTDAENERSETSVPRHPLWLCRWCGCSLIDDPAFAPVATHDDGCPTPDGGETKDGGRNTDGTPKVPVVAELGDPGSLGGYADPTDTGTEGGNLSFKTDELPPTGLVQIGGNAPQPFEGRVPDSPLTP